MLHQKIANLGEAVSLLVEVGRYLVYARTRGAEPTTIAADEREMCSRWP